MILNGKRVRLDQLEREAIAAGVKLINGLAMWGDFLAAPDEKGTPVEVPEGMQAVVDSHVPMRYLTDEELNIMFAEADAAGDHAKMLDVLAQASGRKLREQVPE